MRYRSYFPIAVFFLISLSLIGCTGSKSRDTNAKKSVPTFSISGTVVDDKRKPVSGAQLSLLLIRKSVTSVFARTTSDAAGHYRFNSVPDNRNSREIYYVVIASQSGTFTGWSEPISRYVGPRHPSAVTPTAGEVRVLPLRDHSGTVVDDKGRPLAGVKVAPLFLEFQGMAFVHGFSVSFPMATTSASGKYILKGVPTPPWGIEVVPKKAGYAPYPTRYGVRPERIVMVPAGGIAGTVVDEHGKPLRDKTVLVTREHNRISSDDWSSKTDEYGSFSIGEIPIGTYTVGINSSARSIASRNITGVEVTAGKITKIRPLVIEDGITMDGSVIDSDTGKPVRNGRFSIRPITYKAHFQLNCESDNQGRLKPRLLPGERYSIEVNTAFYNLSEPNPVIDIPKDAKTFHCVLRVVKDQTGEGKVLKPDGKPASGVFVYIPELYNGNKNDGPRSGGYMQPGFVYGFVKTRKDGSFEIGLQARDKPVTRTKVVIQVRNREGTLFAQHTVAWKDLVQGKVVLKLGKITPGEMLKKGRFPWMPPENGVFWVG